MYLKIESTKAQKKPRGDTKKNNIRQQQVPGNIYSKIKCKK